MSGTTNVAVAVRCRPISTKELNLGSKNVVKIDKENASITVDVDQSSETDEKRHSFTFDHVYDGPTEQNEIYSDIGSPLITKALEGFNGTVFAYGQTGSGKTWTMMGSLTEAASRGIVPRLTDDLFERIHKTIQLKGGALGDLEVGAPDPDQDEQPVKFMITVSFLEIYNEVIHDLLNPQSDKQLKVREHPDMGIYVENLCELAVKGSADIFRLIDQGNRVRRVASTAMNERSSRSHSVFTLKIQQKSTKTVEENVERESNLSSKINLVDLAGSERASKTGAEGSTLKEGAAINQSLMALGGVINALSEAAPFVPYRNSKLTRLLQESLGGNARTVMVANVSPADYNAEETVGTLRYASRAKKIQNKVIRNEDVHERIIRELQEEIERLRQELEEAKASPSDSATGDLTPRSQAEIIAREREAIEKEQALKERIANMERAKMSEWEERAQLTAALEEERKNNLNRAVSDVMSNVKQQKLDLINTLRDLQEAKTVTSKQLATLKDKYKDQKNMLEAAMEQYEEKQVFYDQLDPSDPLYEEAGDSLLNMLNEIEINRSELISLREQVGTVKSQVHDIEQNLNMKRAELQAAASTIAENDRLRHAIQEEERKAFQSQRDAYLQEQLQAEKYKLEEERKILNKRASTLTDQSSELVSSQGKAQLLQQELDMFKTESNHLREQYELLKSDLYHSQNEMQRIQDEAHELESRLQNAEYDLEAERELSAQLKEDIWELQRTSETTVADLRFQLSVKQRELNALGKFALEHKEQRTKSPLSEEKLAAIARARQLSLPSSPTSSDGISETPDIAEAKHTATSLTAQAKLGNILQEKDRRVFELQARIKKLERRNAQLEEEAQENGFRVFKGVMDVATQDRQALIAQCEELQKLLQQSVHDILYLQQQNDDYKQKLDLRRHVDGDDE